MGIINTYLRHESLDDFKTLQDAHNAIFRQSILYAVWMMIVFGFYTVLKYTVIYVLDHFEAYRKRYSFLTTGSLIALLLWFMSMFFLIVLKVDPDIVGFWAALVPAGILLYVYAFNKLIPKALNRKRPFLSYLIRVVPFLVVMLAPMCGTGVLLAKDPESGMSSGLLGAIFHLFVSAPVYWLLFQRWMRGNEELFELKEKLGRSDANIDFLRSQINPHFLFNALNTLYGTAIQENADRTGEGIQRLGDMMRFMLQENLQEYIPLAREIDYLENYISLQRLRTDPVPGIDIVAEIQQEVYGARIAPMLLIPFVENAFKHGISLREPAYIKILLELKENSLNFDVHNSRHERPESDPERNKSGVGLDNVRQRLQLLYPDQHELIIRETGKAFFVHLTIRLS
jgi:hypothetical protein